MGSGIEYGIGFWWMAFLYLVSEIGGVLLCITVRPEMYGIGASCAGFGLVGYYFSYLFTNFEDLRSVILKSFFYKITFSSNSF